MSRFTCKHAVAILALLATVSLLAPAPAQAASLSPAGTSSLNDAASWLASLWQQLLMVVHGGGAPARTAPGGRHPILGNCTTAGGSGALPSDGPYINPDGQPTT